MTAGGPRRLAAEVVVDARARLGEGPAWDARSGELIWVDILAGRVHRFDPASGADRFVEVGRHVGVAVPRAAGGLLLAVRGGFAVLGDDGTLAPVADVEADRPGNRMNDGKCDPRGRLWAGTVADDERPGAGALYRLDPDRSVHRMLGGVSISNGLAWSADGATMYYVDSPSQGVDAFDYDPGSGAIARRRRVVSIPRRDGTPDGMAIDDDGCLWVALWGGGRVRRHTPDGRPDAQVELPASQVTSCAFGGPDRGDLYVTSAARGLAGEPLAGALFRCRPGVRGPLAVPAQVR
ncbi:MAG TPA: SMP-30/gluconolactonase/LRE family protein [Actinomycetes bacterium]|nr:SMP-30/gluconolactonase/LRE family protein [Actinomycetes bacterium]